jgi:protein phosphatase
MVFRKNNIHPIGLFAKTDKGKERLTNEDSIATLIVGSQSFIDEINCGILVIADGMGGCEKGEIASATASKIFIKEVFNSMIQTSKEIEKIKFRDILTKSIIVANNEVLKLSEIEANSVGTTIVGAIIIDNHIYIANVGDSRAYLVTPKKSIIQLTVDHSAVQEMLEANIITKEQARNHPRRNVLTKALGLTREISPDIFEADLNDNILLLCSDGLYNLIGEKEILKTMSKNIYNSAEALISLANKQGGSDNISVALAKYHNWRNCPE